MLLCHALVVFTCVLAQGYAYNSYSSTATEASSQSGFGVSSNVDDSIDEDLNVDTDDYSDADDQDDLSIARFPFCPYGEVKNGKCVCPEACILIYDPVCGTDGKNYPSECELEVTACRRRKFISVRHRGYCSSRKPLHRITCANVRCAGPCIDTPKGPKCTRQPIEPAVDSCAYKYCPSGTFCEETLYGGKCVSIGPFCYGPYCSVRPYCNGYYKGGKCIRKCKAGCPKIYRPVCGTNNKTYSNLCLLKFASCKSGNLIGLLHHGVCFDFPGPDIKPFCNKQNVYCRHFKFPHDSTLHQRRNNGQALTGRRD